MAVRRIAIPLRNQEFASTRDLLDHGKALRTSIARAQLGDWRPTSHRADPVRLLRSFDKYRVKELVPIRYGRMLVSPFTFYRGSAAIMAADLARAPRTGIAVQVCGDCHLLNFGAFATPERNIVFSINDFDETLRGPWEWDVERLAASFVLAARANGLSDANGREAAIAAARGYREHIETSAELRPLEAWYARIGSDDALSLVPRVTRSFVRKRVDRARKQSGSEVEFPKLATNIAGQTTIRDKPPLIFHPEAARTAQFYDTLQQVFRLYRETLPDDRRALLDRYHIVDAAMKVVGVGSVGTRCWIALFMSASNDPLFLQLKEARASVLEAHLTPSSHRHHGERVVVGQRLMQPVSDLFLGWMTAPTGIQFYVRQLRDAKIKPLVETFDANTLERYAGLCGWALALSHAKAADVSAIRGYLGASDEFDDAMGRFALAYADQAERDHAVLKAAVRKGEVDVYRDV